MFWILLRASVVVGLLAVVTGVYMIRDAAGTIGIGNFAVAEEQARQEACGGDPACIVNGPQGFDFIGDFAAGLEAQEQVRRGRLILYCGLGLLGWVLAFLVTRWIITGRIRGSMAAPAQSAGGA